MSAKILDTDRCPHCKGTLAKPVPRVCPHCGGSLQQRHMTWGCLSSAPLFVALIAGAVWCALS